MEQNTRISEPDNTSVRAALWRTLHAQADGRPRSKLGITFYLQISLLDEKNKAMQEIAEKAARAAGTPLLSFFTRDEILNLAREARFREAKTVTTKDLEQLYFSGRTDELVPASGEVFLLAAT